MNMNMNTCAVQRVEALQQADHVCIWDKARWPFRYTHHGVVYTPGTTTDEIVIAHVWSNIDGFRESHADSSFRLTSLTEFLNERPISDMRRVQYNSSLVGEMFTQPCEVHRSRSDIPPVVIARCNFLLGLGKGHFSILSLNCEHVALWCKTGVIWSKQLFHKVHRVKVPYISSKATDKLQSLEKTLAKLRQDCRSRYEELCQLHGKRVYLQLSETKFVKRLGSQQQLHVVHNDPRESDLAFRQTPTAFIVHVELKGYHCLKVSFLDPSTNEFLFAKANCVKFQQKRSYHRDSLFQFEYMWNGELQSRRHRRWFVGAQTRDGLVRTFNVRDRAANFQIVDADFVDKMSAPILGQAVPSGVVVGLMDR